MFSPGPIQYVFHILVARYNVLKVPLNTNQPTNLVTVLRLVWSEKLRDEHRLFWDE